MLTVGWPECWQAKPIGTTYQVWTYLPKGHNQMYWTSTASEPPTSYLQSNTMDKTPQTQQRTFSWGSFYVLDPCGQLATQIP